MRTRFIWISWVVGVEDVALRLRRVVVQSLYAVRLAEAVVDCRGPR